MKTTRPPQPRRVPTIFGYLVFLLTVLALMTGMTNAAQPAGENSYDTTDKKPITWRFPTLERLHLIDGLNLIDRASSGMTLSARVKDGKVTEWRVVNERGPVAFDNQPEGDNPHNEFCETCDWLGGQCSAEIDIDNEGFTNHLCCWSDFGCLDCTFHPKLFEEPICGLRCQSKLCDVLNPDAIEERGDSPTPTPRSDVVVLPDLTVLTIEPKSAPNKRVQMSLTDVTGTRMHIPTSQKTKGCPICTTGSDNKTCWALPCLPVKIETR